MTAMRQHDLTLARIRPTAGRLLLGVFLLAAQLAPLAHLARHRNDHTHGPETADHHAVAADDHEHEDEHDHGGWFADDDHGDVPDHDHDGGVPPPPAAPDHGRDSMAHFALALVEGPPPPYLPPPASTLASPPDDVARSHHAPALPQPPARGPPRSH
jgi:hypothetical protein